MKKFSQWAMCLIGLSSVAQTSQELTLKDAINYAIENKVDAKNARLDVENSEYEIKDARGAALPQINATGGLTYNAILQENPIDGAMIGQPGTTLLVAFGQDWNSVAGLSLNQKIFDMTVFTGLKAAKTTREFYKLNETLTDEMLTERVATMYYEVLVTEEKLKVIDSLYNNTARVKNSIQGLFDNGLAKKIDLDRMQVSLSNLAAQKQQLINASQLQSNALKFLIGMPIESHVVLVNQEMELVDLNNIQAPDVKNRTQYQAMLTQEQLYKYNKQAQAANMYPKMSLTGNYFYQGFGPEVPWFKTPTDNVYWTDYANVGLSLNIPIFTGGSNSARVQKADVTLRKHQESVKDTELALTREFYDAVTQLNNAKITLDVQKDNQELALSVYSDTQNNYVNGLATLTDLLDAQNQLTQAQNNYNTALLESKKAEILVLKARGELNKLRN